MRYFFNVHFYRTTNICCLHQNWPKHTKQASINRKAEFTTAVITSVRNAPKSFLLFARLTFVPELRRSVPALFRSQSSYELRCERYAAATTRRYGHAVCYELATWPTFFYRAWFFVLCFLCECCVCFHDYGRCSLSNLAKQPTMTFPFCRLVGFFLINSGVGGRVKYCAEFKLGVLSMDRC